MKYSSWEKMRGVSNSQQSPGHHPGVASLTVHLADVCFVKVPDYSKLRKDKQRSEDSFGQSSQVHLGFCTFL